jgi:S1-C subfamily serine protease
VIYVQREASPTDAVKPGTPVMHAVGLVQLPADALARTGLRPGDVVITIDGKEIHDTSQAAAILKTRDNCKPLRIELLREGKLLTFVIHPPSDAGNSPCGDEP